MQNAYPIIAPKQQICAQPINTKKTSEFFSHPRQYTLSAPGRASTEYAPIANTSNAPNDLIATVRGFDGVIRLMWSPSILLMNTYPATSANGDVIHTARSPASHASPD